MKPEHKQEFMSNLAKLFGHLKKELSLQVSPKVVLDTDQKNADKILGKTAFYDPEKKEIHLFIIDRHPKDILRSFSHEVVHHWQHEHNQLDKGKKGEDPQYAQHDMWMRQMEKQAYLLGNMLFRDWEDKKKATDNKSGKTVTKETAPMTPAIQKYLDKDHAYRKHVEPESPDGNEDNTEIYQNYKENTLMIGKEYPARKPSYKG